VSAPTLELFNHQETQPVSIEAWQSHASLAIPSVLASAKSPDAPLHQLETIEISLVSDEAIAQVHGDFMDDPTPTDVITFHHGEIVISLDTAHRQAAENGEPYEREVIRYIIHGLLHLAGWDDRDETERKAMHEVQERILASL
jgi:probable rRNA maturation factor